MKAGPTVGANCSVLEYGFRVIAHLQSSEMILRNSGRSLQNQCEVGVEPAKRTPTLKLVLGNINFNKQK